MTWCIIHHHKCFSSVSVHSFRITWRGGAGGRVKVCQKKKVLWVCTVSSLYSQLLKKKSLNHMNSHKLVDCRSLHVKCLKYDDILLDFRGGRYCSWLQCLLENVIVPFTVMKWKHCGEHCSGWAAGKQKQLSIPLQKTRSCNSSFLQKKHFS